SHSISSSAVFSSDTSTATPGASARRSAVNARCYVSGKREGLVAPELVEWREFFVTTATVAGALVGLLFIAISLHLPLLSDDRHADLRLDARSVLIGYVFPLALSLLPLIPQSLSALGEELLVLFLYMIATTVWAVPRDPARTNRPRSPRAPPAPARRCARPDNAVPRCDRCRSRRRGTRRVVPSHRDSRSPR